MRRNKKIKKRQSEALERLLKTEAVLRDARKLIDAAGMAMTWRRVKTHGIEIAHVLIDDLHGTRLLEWWPSNETWYARSDGTRGKCPDIDAAVWIADQKR